MHLFEGAVFSARSRGRRHCPSLTGTLRTRRTGAPQARSPGVGPRRELAGQRTHPITQLVRLLDDERKAEADKDRQDPVETLGRPRRLPAGCPFRGPPGRGRRCRKSPQRACRAGRRSPGAALAGPWPRRSRRRPPRPDPGPRAESMPEIVLEPTDMPCGNRSMILRDPDGGLVNIFAPVTPDARARYDR